MRSVAMITGVILLLQLSPVHAVKLSGRVIVTKEFREDLEKKDQESSSARDDYYWKQPNGIIAVLPPRVNPSKDLGVILLKKGDDQTTPDEVATIKIHTGGLERKVIVARPKSTIKFLNESPFNHELYSPQLAAFKPEMQSSKSFRPIEFPEEGVYEVKCKLMPNFLAYVVITSGRDVEVKADGTIAGELDKGDYTLKVFHDGKWVHKHSFSVDGGRLDPLEVKLVPGEVDEGGSSEEAGGEEANKEEAKDAQEKGDSKQKK